MANKVTNKEMFLKVKAQLTDADLIDFIDSRIALIDKKAEAAKNATRKPSKVQVANEAIKADILGYMAGTDAAVTIADIKANFDLSSQKITPLMTALVNDGKVTKTVEKRVSYFSLV